jgi:transposase
MYPARVHEGALAQEVEERREAARRALGRQLDEEAARRDAASNAARLPGTLPCSLSSARRGRLFGHTDPNAELVLYAKAWARKIQLNTTSEMFQEAAKRPHTDPLVIVAIRRDGPVESVTFVLSSGEADKHERRTARALHVQLAADGYSGGYTRLTDFIREWRAEQGKLINTSAFVPLAFELGEAFQFDWSEEGLFVGGIYHRLQVSHMKLCASRAFWLVAYPSQGHEMLFDAHSRSFAALGGVPRRGIYDNMKTAIDKVKKGKGQVVNARFAVMCAHYLFDADFCNVASGWEKGIVEKNVQDSRRRIWIDAGQRRFGSFTELNAWLADRCRLSLSMSPSSLSLPVVRIVRIRQTAKECATAAQRRRVCLAASYFAGAAGWPR